MAPSLGHYLLKRDQLSKGLMASHFLAAFMKGEVGWLTQLSGHLPWPLVQFLLLHNKSPQLSSIDPTSHIHSSLVQNVDKACLNPVTSEASEPQVTTEGNQMTGVI